MLAQLCHTVIAAFEAPHNIKRLLIVNQMTVMPAFMIFAQILVAV